MGAPGKLWDNFPGDGGVRKLIICRRTARLVRLANIVERLGGIAATTWVLELFSTRPRMMYSLEKTASVVYISFIGTTGLLSHLI